MEHNEFFFHFFLAVIYFSNKSKILQTPFEQKSNKNCSMKAKNKELLPNIDRTWFMTIFGKNKYTVF